MHTELTAGRQRCTSRACVHEPSDRQRGVESSRTGRRGDSDQVRIVHGRTDPDVHLDRRHGRVTGRGSERHGVRPGSHTGERVRAVRTGRRRVRARRGTGESERRQVRRGPSSAHDRTRDRAALAVEETTRDHGASLREVDGHRVARCDGDRFRVARIDGALPESVRLGFDDLIGARRQPWEREDPVRARHRRLGRTGGDRSERDRHTGDRIVRAVDRDLTVDDGARCGTTEHERLRSHRGASRYVEVGCQGAARTGSGKRVGAGAQVREPVAAAGVGHRARDELTVDEQLHLDPGEDESTFADDAGDAGSALGEQDVDRAARGRVQRRHVAGQMVALGEPVGLGFDECVRALERASEREPSRPVSDR